jgi:hypothetical protein
VRRSGGVDVARCATVKRAIILSSPAFETVALDAVRGGPL